MNFLKIDGRHIVDQFESNIVLRGVCLGGYLNMENFITGFPGQESNLRKVLISELGEKRGTFFVERLLRHFLNESDFEFLKSIGVNVVRLPINYHHLEKDEKPFEYIEEGFEKIDRVVEMAKKWGIYVILDLHVAPGFQNNGWHCDNSIGVPLLWKHPHFQERTLKLWEAIAARYANEPAVAGYDMLNEPSAPTPNHLSNFYRRLIESIREKDQNHIIFLESDVVLRKFKGFDDFDSSNLAYSSHNYLDMTLGGRSYPGYMRDKWIDKNAIEEEFIRTNDWVLKNNLAGWVGEFGAIFDGTVKDMHKINALSDQIDVFEKHEHSWTIWTYKDVNVTAPVYVNPESEYIKRIERILKIKHELGTDYWGTHGGGILREFRDTIGMRISRTVGHNGLDIEGMKLNIYERGLLPIVGDYLACLYANAFSDLNTGGIDKVLKEAFSFENCVIRPHLVEVLSSKMKRFGSGKMS